VKPLVRAQVPLALLYAAGWLGVESCAGGETRLALAASFLATIALTLAALGAGSWRRSRRAAEFAVHDKRIAPPANPQPVEP
jgi:hypothetical protein